MPKGQNLTHEIRQRGATRTNANSTKRKAERQAKVKEMLRERIPKGEIAKRLGVRRETISRDVRELKAKGKL